MTKFPLKELPYIEKINKSLSKISKSFNKLSPETRKNILVEIRKLIDYYEEKTLKELEEQ